MKNYDKTIHCKAGTVELNRQEAQEIYEGQRYVVTSTAIWQPFYSQAQDRYYFQRIIDYKGIARRGRFYVMTAQEINSCIGQEILIV